MGTRLEQVEQIIRLLETRGGVAEIDGAVAGDVQVVGELEGQTFGLSSQYLDLPLRVDGQQAPVSVGDDQHAGGVEVHAQRSALGVGEGRDTAVGLKAHDAAVLQAGVDPARGVHGGVFRAMQLATAEQFGLHQGVVGFQHASHGRGGRRLPGQRVDGAGSDGQVGRRGGDRQDE
ncbi:hypothetical protein D3C84_827550 [compost metagenome]